MACGSRNSRPAPSAPPIAHFLEKTGYSADGLEAVSREVHTDRAEEHPYAWFGRRERDIHDIWHVLTGYPANDPLGELCLVAFTYAQTKGLGWGFIALSGALKSFAEPHGRAVRRAIREGYAHGRAAHWLHNEDIEKLFAEPLDAARARLNIAPPLTLQACAGSDTEHPHRSRPSPPLETAKRRGSHRASHCYQNEMLLLDRRVDDLCPRRRVTTDRFRPRHVARRRTRVLVRR